MDSHTPSRPEVLARLYELMKQVNAAEELQGVLDAIALGVTEVLGYGVAAISQVEGDTLVATSVSAPEDVRREILGHRTAASSVVGELDVGDHWGVLRYIPHERLAAPLEEAAWIPDIEPIDHPDAWHPHDTLYAPLHSATGALLGVMSVDLPRGGLIPPPGERELLEMFVVQAGLALDNAQQRERLARAVRMEEMLRRLSAASRMVDLSVTLRNAAATVAEGFGTDRVWVRCFDDPHGEGGATLAFPDVEVDPEVVSRAVALAERAAHEGRAIVISAEDLRAAPEVSRRALERSMTDSRIDTPSLLMTPIGGARDLVGYLVVAREDASTPWSEEELQAAMEAGRTLGRVVLDVRLFEREHRLVDELRELDRYREDLVATVSHELKTPLTSIIGHVELLGDLGLAPIAASVEAIARNSKRLDQLVRDLLDYSSLGERGTGARAPVDLRDLARLAAETVAVQVERGSLALRLDLPDDAVTVMADAEQLRTVVDNLVVNAVKYTRPGGRVTVGVSCGAEHAVLRCTDTGMGISPVDQLRLFTAFHRSSNPEALALPGSGLGLAIAQRIAHLHRGEITVSSRLGVGSTFTLRLPATPA